MGRSHETAHPDVELEVKDVLLVLDVLVVEATEDVVDVVETLDV